MNHIYYTVVLQLGCQVSRFRNAEVSTAKALAKAIALVAADEIDNSFIDQRQELCQPSQLIEENMIFLWVCTN